MVEDVRVYVLGFQASLRTQPHVWDIDAVGT
jgi:hypothetical protein